MPQIPTVESCHIDMNPVSSDEEQRRKTRITLAERALQIYSPSGEEAILASYIISELRSQHMFPRIDSAGNVLCEIGNGNRTLLFCPHIDTVPGKLPFKREGNILYARGACDAKGALLSMLFAFEDIALELRRDPSKKTLGRVIFAGVVEEERESKGLVQLISDGIRADAAIFGEPCGLSKVTIGYRGHIPVSIEVHTKPAHSSAPWVTSNAAEVAFSLFKMIREELSRGKAVENVDSISVAITKIESGTSHNVIPGRANMTLDVRLPIGTETGKIANEIRNIASETESKNNCEIITVVGTITEPYRAKLDSGIVRSINRAILKLGFAKPSFITKSGTGDMNTYAHSFGVDSITYGPGDTKLSHTDSEFIDMEEVFACAEVLVRTQSEFFELAKGK